MTSRSVSGDAYRADLRHGGRDQARQMADELVMVPLLDIYQAVLAGCPFVLHVNQDDVAVGVA
jgi:hypothetical protein